MHFVDHIFIFLLFVVQPIHGALEFRRYIKKVEAGEPADRIKLYRQTLILEWVSFAALAAVWYFFGRPIADLGFVALGGGGFWTGAALLVLVCGYLGYLWRAATRMTRQEKAGHAKSFGKIVHFLPRTDREYHNFFGLSITAGIVEETIYRGFVFWYLAQVMPLWAVVVVSSVAFGLAHSYQGAAGVFRVTLMGLVLGVFYLLTGSIWLPILGHALVDILQGAMLVEILRKDDDGAAAQAV